MLRPKPRLAVLFVVSALVLTSLLASGLRRASARLSTVTAQAVQRWSHSKGGYTVTVLGDGTLVTSGNGVPAQRIRPEDGFRFADGRYVFNLRTAGLTTGTYLLVFKAGAATTTHAVQFQIK